MRKTLITFGTVLGGMLYAAIWTIILYFAFNYREISNGEGAFLFIIMFVCFYNFGIYITAALLRLFSKREKARAPSALVDGSSNGWKLIYLVIGIIFFVAIVFNLNVLAYSILLIIVLAFQLWIYPAYALKINKYTSLKHLLKRINNALLIHLILLVVICYNGFPGVNAPIEMRQKWAYEKFRHYPAMVHSIEESNEIREKVGKIKFVAPTKGRNLHVVIGGSSGPASEFTLEVLGDKGTGIAYVCSWGESVTGLGFKYQGKKIVLTKWGRGMCNY